MACNNSCISAEATKEFLEYIKTYIDENVPSPSASGVLELTLDQSILDTSTSNLTKASLASLMGITEADVDDIMAGDVLYARYTVSNSTYTIPLISVEENNGSTDVQFAIQNHGFALTESSGVYTILVDA